MIEPLAFAEIGIAHAAGVPWTESITLIVTREPRATVAESMQRDRRALRRRLRQGRGWPRRLPDWPDVADDARLRSAAGGSWRANRDRDVECRRTDVEVARARWRADEMQRVGLHRRPSQWSVPCDTVTADRGAARFCYCEAHPETVYAPAAGGDCARLAGARRLFDGRTRASVRGGRGGSGVAGTGGTSGGAGVGGSAGRRRRRRRDRRERQRRQRRRRRRRTGDGTGSGGSVGGERQRPGRWQRRWSGRRHTAAVADQRRGRRRRQREPVHQQPLRSRLPGARGRRGRRPVGHSATIRRRSIACSGTGRRGRA